MSANILNESGSVKELFNELHNRSIKRFKTIDEIIEFGKNYQHEINEFRRNKLAEIQEETEALIKEKQRLDKVYIEQKADLMTNTTGRMASLKHAIGNSSSGFFQRTKIFFPNRISYST